MRKKVFYSLMCLVFSSLFFIGCSSVTKKKLKNDAPLLVRQSKEMPREVVSIIFPGGPSLFSADKQGATEILSFILQEGPRGMTGDEFRRQLFLLNADVQFSGERRAFKVTVTVPRENLKRALLLIDRVLKKPQLNIKNFRRSQKRVMSLTNLNFDRMQNVIFYYGIRETFNEHPDTFKGQGSPKSVKGIRLQDLQKNYKNVIDWSSAFFAAVGPMSGGKLQLILEEIWAGDTGVVKYKKFQFPILDANNYKTKNRKVVLIHQKNAKDNKVLFVYPDNVVKASKEQIEGEVAHQILGGGLSGRLGNELRVKRGLTYYAGSFLMSSVPGWAVYTFGGSKQIQALIEGIPEVVTRFSQEKLKQKEVDLAKDVLMNRFKEGRELPYERLAEDVRFFLYDLNSNYLSNYLEQLNDIDVSDINSFRENHIEVNGGHLYVMGDRRILLPLLKKLGYDYSEIKIVNKREIL